MTGALDLPNAAGAGGQRRVIGVPAPRVSGNVDDAPVHDVRIDDAPAIAIMAAGAGDNRFPRAGARGLVDGFGYSFSSRKRSSLGANRWAAEAGSSGEVDIQ